MHLPRTTAITARHPLRCHVALKSISRPRHLSTAAEAPTHEGFDIVVVGGGPVGLALAGALNSSYVVRDKLRVALVEAGDLDKIRSWNMPPDKYSNRVSSLTNSSHAFLEDIHAWNHVEEHRTCSIKRMQVWDGVSDARIHFDASETTLASNDNGMARITENLNLQRGLLRLLQDAPTVELIHKTKVTSIARGSEDIGAWPIVNLDNGRRLRSRLLVGADGLNSPVRTYAQIPTFGWSYDARGIVATFSHRPRTNFEGPNATAYQRFLPTGPIAFLPLTPTISSLVWSTRPHIAQALEACEPSVFASMINAAFRLPHLSLQYLYDVIIEAREKGTPLTAEQIQAEIIWRERSHGIDQHSALASGAAMQSTNAPVGIPPEDSDSVPPLITSIQQGTVASFPLRFNHAEYYIGEGMGSRTVLVGDAAHTVHPLAGQGLNLGLGDVECLAKCIEDGVLQGSDIGSHTALQPYARQRYLVNHTFLGTVDKLHKLYSTDFEPLVWARSVGLEVVNELDALKSAIMMTAGASARQQTAGTSWDFVAKGVETLNDASRAAETIGNGIRNAVGAGLQSIAKGMSKDRSV